MSWLAFFTLAFRCLSAALDLLRDKRAFDGVEAEVFSRYAKGALDEIRKATEIREAVRADIAAHPERVREPDRFSRD